MKKPRERNNKAWVVNLIALAASLAVFTLIVWGVLGTQQAAAFHWQPPEQGGFENTIRVAATADYDPYSYLDENGNPAGFDVELAYAIGEKLGVNVEIHLGLWDTVKASAERGEYDLLMSVTLSDARRETLELSHAVVQDAFQSFGYDSANRAASPEQNSIAVIRGGYESNISVLKDFIHGITEESIMFFDTYAEEIEAVRSGACAYAVVPSRYGERYISRRQLSGISPQGLPVYTSPFCIGTAKGNTALIEQVNEAITQIDSEGTLEEINRHWFENNNDALMLLATMGNTLSYIEANGVCIIILAMILLNEYRIKDRADYRVLFSRYLLFSILSLIVDSLWLLINQNIIPNTAWSVGVINYLYMAVTEIVAYLWLLNSYAFTRSSRLRSRQSRFKAALPIIAVCLFVLIQFSMGKGVFFDNSGRLHNPATYLIALTPMVVCLILAAVQCIKKAKEHRYAADRLQFVAMALVPVFIALTNLLQLKDLNLPTTGYGMTISCLFVYLVFLQNMISLDSLTQMNNRNQLERFISSLDASGQEQELCMMMIDANNFKSINDIYGHASGDDALRAISMGLKTACGTMGDLRPFIARYGGDEFFVALRTKNEEQVQDAAICIHQAIDKTCKKMNLPYKFSVSIGWAFLHAGEYGRECIARADAALYKEKKKLHNR